MPEREQVASEAKRGETGENIKRIRLETVDSTNRYLKSRILEGDRVRAAVTAVNQTGGKGRMNRVWRSPPGGLYLSLSTPLAENVPPVAFPVQAAIAAATLLYREFELPLRLKWPNDLQLYGQKICGILSELVHSSSGIAHAIVGIGLNANAGIVLDDAFNKPIWLAKVLAREIDVDRLGDLLAADILDQWDRLDEASMETLREQWKALSDTLNRRVEVRTLRGTIRGVAVDLSPEFELRIRPDDGGPLVAVCEGDCRSLRPDPWEKT